MSLARILALSFLLTVGTTAYAQITPDTTWVRAYAKNLVDSLASPRMKGRGYVGDGHKIAASYIAREFKNIGLRSFGNGYFQEFPISVNTFPNIVNLKLGKNKLTPGTDYLIAPCSNTIKGKYRVHNLSLSALLNKKMLLASLTEAQDKILIVDQSLAADSSKAYRQAVQDGISFLATFRNNPAVALVVLTNDKLSWHIAQQPCALPQFTVRKDALKGKLDRVELDIESLYEQELITQNVIGFLAGTEPEAGIIVISAHYDHLGQMGLGTYFPGANDNASGTAMMLSLAKALKKSPIAASVVFIAFGAEEVGLLGSQFFTQNPLVPLDQVKFMLNLDITGTGEDGIKVVNGSVFTDQFSQLQLLNKEHKYLTNVSARGEACNSDHCPLYQAGVPAFFIYTLGGIQAYHDPLDRAETLPLTAFPQLFCLLVNFVQQL